MFNSRSSTPSVNPVLTLAYWRRSSDQQEASIPQQQSWGRDTCARDNLKLVGEELDDAISGSEIDSRDGLQRIIALAEELFRKGSPARRLLVWKCNRLSRADSCATHAKVIQPLRDAGILHVQTQDGRLVDLHNRNDLLLFNIEQDAQNAAFLSSLASDVMRGKADAARQGCWNGGPVPMGYRLEYVVVNSGRRRLPRLVLGPAEEIEVVRFIFTHYLEKHVSTTSLARQLSAKGIKARRASHWSGTQVTNVLKQRAYLGETRWNGIHCGKFCRLTGGQIQDTDKQGREEDRRRKGSKRLAKVRNDAADCIIVQQAHEPIISPDLFSAVQEKLTSWVGRRRTPEARFHELEDLLTCGHCDAKCWIRSNRRGPWPTISRVVCSRSRQEGKQACPLSSTEQETVVLSRVLAVLARDLGGEKAQQKIKDELRRKVEQSGVTVTKKRKALQEEVDTLEARRVKEARRLLALPDNVLASATEAHQETLAALAVARDQLDQVGEENHVNAVTAALAERAITMVQSLPAVSGRIAELQARITQGDSSVDPKELLEVRRGLRDVLFALVSSVRLTWLPLSAAERKGKGKGFRKAILDDVQVTLHPAIQAALINDAVSEGTLKRSSLNCNIAGPIILSFKSPFAA